jgi:hypothetical protein
VCWLLKKLIGGLIFRRVCCACPTDTARQEEMIAAGGTGVVNDYWLRIEARLLGLFWPR